jgi:hypothetical protein
MRENVRAAAYLATPESGSVMLIRNGISRRTTKVGSMQIRCGTVVRVTVHKDDRVNPFDTALVDRTCAGR